MGKSRLVSCTGNLSFGANYHLDSLMHSSAIHFVSLAPKLIIQHFLALRLAECTAAASRFRNPWRIISKYDMTMQDSADSPPMRNVPATNSKPVPQNLPTRQQKALRSVIKVFVASTPPNYNRWDILNSQAKRCPDSSDRHCNLLHSLT